MPSSPIDTTPIIVTDTPENKRMTFSLMDSFVAELATQYESEGI